MYESSEAPDPEVHREERPLRIRIYVRPLRKRRGSYKRSLTYTLYNTLTYTLNVEETDTPLT